MHCPLLWTFPTLDVSEKLLALRKINKAPESIRECLVNTKSLDFNQIKLILYARNACGYMKKYLHYYISTWNNMRLYRILYGNSPAHQSIKFINWVKRDHDKKRVWGSLGVCDYVSRGLLSGSRRVQKEVW